MRVRELLDILRDQSPDLEVELALVAPVEDDEATITVDRFPVDGVKLDRSFVAGVAEDPGDAAIVAAVVRLAHALGKECIAEGVEQEHQRAALLGLGCGMGQGYLFSKPLPAADLGALLDGAAR